MKPRIRALLHAVPFQPFVIHMADGQQYHVEHPDFVLASTAEIPQITVETRDGGQHTLSALFITSVELLPATSVA